LESYVGDSSEISNAEAAKDKINSSFYGKLIPVTNRVNLDEKEQPVGSVNEPERKNFELGENEEVEIVVFKKEELNGIEEMESNPAPEIEERVEKKMDAADKKAAGVMSVKDALEAKYARIGLTGDWLRLIGDACLPTHIFVHGPGGSGKSGLVLKFADYLAEKGYPVLYVAAEQYGTPTFKELLQRTNITGGENLKIVKSIDTLNPADFTFIVLDSKDSLGIGKNEFKELVEKYPDQSFIILSQSKKNGDFTGAGEWRNLVDVMIVCKNGTVSTNGDKNRWGGHAEMVIFTR